MVGKLLLLLGLCALLAPAPAVGSSEMLDILGGIVDALYEYFYEGTEMPTEGGPEDYDWLYEFLESEDVCDPNPCLNNGECEVKGDSFKCTCPEPYTGKRCQKVRNYCKKKNCGRGEYVIISVAPYYECKCKVPFQPPTCRKAVACKENPCLNGGTCIKGRTRSRFTCACPANYTGKFCQVGPDDCFREDGSYDGFVSETEEGIECLPWNSHQLLEKLDEDVSMSQDEAALREHNYCRNPDKDVRPWCFVKLKGKLNWNHCNVTQCPGSDDITVPLPPTDDPSDPASPTDAVSTEFTTCGRPQPSDVVARIYGGRKSIPGAHPWQVSLQVRVNSSDNEFEHMCGAALIQPCWALTAAHCIIPHQSWRVLLGSVNLHRDEWTRQAVDVEETIVHENYTETTEALHNDIALLKLKPVDGRCARETRFVKTVCLPEETFADGTECTISGWGATPDRSFSQQLLDAQVLLIPQWRCAFNSSYGDKLDESMLCAGRLRGGVDSCQGDSGGPLVCEKDGKHFVYGVVSWGDRCGVKNKPGIYARVTEFTDWIKAKIEAA
ncbi:hypothetical protein MATL_G00014830 [Megalops atlanticus]|uniref:trypsin n=1 Tax=Megalops atlanticus TaxID=7932 RepID=A0A9D3TK07_MEGAT|nr:hypothetical protein MATL_G00014830 [Megalops atlanticus]